MDASASPTNNEVFYSPECVEGTDSDVRFERFSTGRSRENLGSLPGLALSQSSEMTSALSGYTLSVPAPQRTVSLTPGTSLDWTVSRPPPS